MALTSASFLLFFALSLLIYYLIPGKNQWIRLLLFSAAFFLLSAKAYTVVYLVMSILSTWFCAVKIAEAKETGKENRAKILLAVGIVINLGILALLKYSNFLIDNTNWIISAFGGAGEIPKLSLLAPLGISFYTMQVLGYLLDAYWGIAVPQRNLFKTALFVGYFPQLTSGPIARYNQVENQLYRGHRFDAQAVIWGLWRILWGIFKKLVISARVGILVDTIYGDTAAYQGLYIWLAAGLFMLQLYTDFSGCMDIILGVSACYGIQLPENFKTPFFSRSIQEFWQRWHITLGAWLKDYILYPVLRAKAWRNMTKWIKAHWGKKAAKQIPAYLGMLCVWLLIGLWHGGNWKYVFGQGIWFWLLIVLSQVCEPAFAKLRNALKINTASFGWHIFQSVRVYCLVCLGNMFFRLESFPAAVRTMKLGFAQWNPRILVDGSLYRLGLEAADFWIMVLSLAVLFVVDVLSEKKSVRERIYGQKPVVRFLLLLALVFSILISGMYGIGFDAQSFIYESF